MGIFSFLKKLIRSDIDKAQKVISDKSAGQHVPPEYKNIDEFLQDIKKKGAAPFKIEPEVFKALKEIADTPEWYKHLDKGAIKNLNIFAVKWENAVKPRNADTQAAKVTAAGGFEEIEETPEEPPELDADTVYYTVNEETGEFYLCEDNFKFQQKIKNINISNSMLELAYVPYFYMSKNKFLEKYYRMIAKIELQTGREIQQNQFAEECNIETQTLTAQNIENITKIMQKNCVNSYNHFLKMDKNIWKALLYWTYCDEIYVIGWDKVNPQPLNVFSQNLYEQNKVLFDKKNEFILNNSLKDFIIRQFFYFSFLENGITEELSIIKGDKNNMSISSDFINFLENIAVNDFINILKLLIMNEDNIFYMPDLVVWDNGKVNFYLTKKGKTKINDKECANIAYFIKYNIPINIIRTAD